MSEAAFYYRYETVWHGSESDWPVEVRLHKYLVLSKTPKGIWIERSWPTSKTFILNDSRKKWAHPTMEGARESFIRRKHRQIHLLSHQLKLAEDALKIAEEGLPQPPRPRGLFPWISPPGPFAASFSINPEVGG